MAFIEALNSSGGGGVTKSASGTVGPIGNSQSITIDTKLSKVDAFFAGIYDANGNYSGVDWRSDVMPTKSRSYHYRGSSAHDCSIYDFPRTSDFSSNLCRLISITNGVVTFNTATNATSYGSQLQWVAVEY